MPVGSVKWFCPKLGYGFVTAENGEDVFVHFSVIEGRGFRALLNGEVVEYEMTRGPKGLLASKVRRVQEAEQPKPAANPGDTVDSP